MRQGKIQAAQLIALILLALAAVAAARAAQSPLDALFACQEISADAARLACLDREVAALRGDSGSGQPIAADRDKSKEDSYGLDRHDGIEGLENLAVARISETPYGKLVVKLQNGQVWTQIDPRKIFVPRGTPHEQMTASIRNAALGSHKMQLNGDGPWFRVRREK